MLEPLECDRQSKYIRQVLINRHRHSDYFSPHSAVRTAGHRNTVPKIIENRNRYTFLEHTQTVHFESILLTLYFATKSKNRPAENGCDVKMRVFLNAATTVTQIPENQYNELKHSITNSKSSAPAANVLNSSACDMQIDFGKPVDPDEQASNAVCADGSLMSAQLKM